MKRNRIIQIPERYVRALNEGVIVKDTTLLCSERAGLIYLPGSDRLDMDKVVEIGEVVAIGSKVPEGELEVGDIVIYRRLTAFWLPNALEKAFLWKIEYPFSIIAVVSKSDSRPVEKLPEAPMPDSKWLTERSGFPIEHGLGYYVNG